MELRDGQRTAIALIQKNKNILCVFPTGYGKTIVGIAAVKQSASQGELSFFVSPLTALSTQLSKDLTKDGIKVLLDIGSHRAEKISDYNNYQAIITTYERLDSILRSEKKRSEITKEIGYVVIDEYHNLGSSNRSQSVFSDVMKLKVLFSSVRFVGLSATIGNMKEVADEINAEVVYIPPEQRPIKLDKVYLKYSAMNNVDAVYKRVELTRNLLNRHQGQCLALVFSKKLSQKLADMFNRFGIPAACHNAGIPYEKRIKIEEDYKAGKYRILFCTTTLAMGMNLPGDFAIVFDYKIWNPLKCVAEFPEDGRMLFDQFIGRAGRPGITKTDKAYAFFLVEESDFQQLYDIMRDDIIISKKVDCMSLICDWTTSGLYADVQDLTVDLETLADADPEKIEEAMQYLVEHHFVEIEGDDILATKLGNLAAWFFVHPKVVVALQSLRIEPTDVQTLAQLFTMIPELDNAVRYEKNTDDLKIAHAAAKLKALYNLVLDSNEMLKTVYYLFYNSFDNADEVRSTGNNLSGVINRYLACAGIFVQNKQVKESLGRLSFMLDDHKLLNKGEIALAMIDGIGKKRLDKLKAAKITDIERFMKTNNDELSRIVGLREVTIQKIKQEIRKR